MTSDLRVAVIGCGSIGLRHVRNLISLGQPTIAIDVDAERRAAAAALGVPTARSLEAIDPPDVAVVCTPATDHVETALDALGRGAHVLVEKPIAASLDDGRRLRDAALRSDRLVGVAYNLRYDEALRALRAKLEHGAIGRVLYAQIEFGQYLPDWRAGRDYRTTVTARRVMGGGVLLEASHELDVLRWLFGEWSTVRAVVGTLSDLEIDVEDSVAAIVEADRAPVVEVHLDLVRRGYTRRLTCVGTDGTLEWRLRDGTTVTRSDGSPTLVSAAAGVDAMYVAEMRDFLRAVAERAAPPITADDGVAALELIEAIRRASDTGETVRR